MAYAVRYFFDAGSGICLWAANKSARDRFGHPIDTAVLRVSPGLRQEMSDVCAFFDSSVDWTDPGGPSPWPRTTSDAFARRADALLQRLRQELRPDFTIADERPNPTAG
jgi:hypothetical protein